MDSFYSTATSRDVFNEKNPVLRLDDLPRRLPDKTEVSLSILVSANDYRYAQLARSLECLCRQEWREFEVLICDNGSSKPLQPLAELFEPYLRIKFLRLERSQFSACPTRGIKALLPMAEGEVIAIMQPELMLHPLATKFLRFGEELDWPESIRYKIAYSNVSLNGRPRWTVLKPMWIGTKTMEQIDSCDWHSDLTKISEIPGFFYDDGGLGPIKNTNIAHKREFPWWFAGAADREAKIWNDMPEFDGYSTIDLWLLGYRFLHEYVDIAPVQILAYHQRHVTTMAQPDHELFEPVKPSEVTKEETKDWLPMDLNELRGLCRQYGLEDGDEDESFEELWSRYWAAKHGERNGETSNDPTMASVPVPIPVLIPAPAASIRIQRIRDTNPETK